jgi:hypothetical protein
MSDQDDDLGEDVGLLEPWPKMLQLTADLAVQPRKVAAVKRSSLNEEHCTVFLSGQSATDGGFVVERAFEDVVDEINAGLDGDEDDFSDDDPDGADEAD